MPFQAHLHLVAAREGRRALVMVRVKRREQADNKLDNARTAQNSDGQCNGSSGRQGARSARAILQGNAGFV